MLERLYSDASAEPPISDPPRATAAARPADTAKLPAVPARQQLEAARATLAQLELRLSPEHPDVVRTKHLIESLEQQVADEDLRRAVSPEAAAPTSVSPEEVRRRDKLREMRAEIESLDRQVAFKEGEERNLRAEVAGYQARLEAIPGIESEWLALTRDHDTLQTSYRELLSKSENSKMAASLEQRQIGEQFRILDPPRLPLKPYSPNRLKINLLGLLAGLVLAVGLLAVGEYRDVSLRSEADVQDAVGLPVLVLLPFATTDQDVRRQRRRRLLLSAATVVVCLATGALFWVLKLWKFVV
jgi:uncharacterized protein involved in exopolysaccharide biosynthesis